MSIKYKCNNKIFDSYNLAFKYSVEQKQRIKREIKEEIKERYPKATEKQVILLCSKLIENLDYNIKSFEE